MKFLLFSFAIFDNSLFLPRVALRGDQIANNVCRVATWPVLENVMERSDMTRFIQTLDMWPKGLA
jgi:hypothetical protein